LRRDPTALLTRLLGSAPRCCSPGPTLRSSRSARRRRRSLSRSCKGVPRVPTSGSPGRSLVRSGPGKGTDTGAEMACSVSNAGRDSGPGSTPASVKRSPPGRPLEWSRDTVAPITRPAPRAAAAPAASRRPGAPADPGVPAQLPVLPARDPFVQQRPRPYAARSGRGRKARKLQPQRFSRSLLSLPRDRRVLGGSVVQIARPARASRPPHGGRSSLFQRSRAR